METKAGEVRVQRRLLHQGYLYTKNKAEPNADYYRCSVKTCKTKGVMRNGVFQRGAFQHTHPPADANAIEAQELYNQLKLEARTSTVPTAHLFGQVIANVSKLTF